MNVHEKLRDYGHLVYTVGDGCPPNTFGVNELSRANAHAAAEIAQRTNNAILFIAGGNGGEHGKRGFKEKGCLQEAHRMRRYIEERFTNIPLITDCDPAFHERFPHLAPSTNTVENARNAAYVTREGEYKSVDVVAEELHLPRVIGTYRRQLHALKILEALEMHAYPVKGSFEQDNDQWHIRNRMIFRCWNALSNIHHLLTGEVMRSEYLQQILNRKPYRNLYQERR